MKLIGSLIEEEYRADLKEGNRHLLEGRGDPVLLDVLNREIGVIRSAYFLSGYKVSGYHTCVILVNGSIVCSIEISDGHVDEFCKISLSKYKNGLNKQGRINLQVALDLSEYKLFYIEDNGFILVVPVCGFSVRNEADRLLQSR